ncbi:MAG: hypothetical protein HY292_02055 [Planctomycetes bacterium]|nr:hypothetical protein [Planctomycetota bacterium]
MAVRTAHDHFWGVGTCQNSRCGKLGVDLFPITIRVSTRSERSWTFEVCKSCKGAFDRGDLKLHQMPPDRGPQSAE